MIKISYILLVILASILFAGYATISSAEENQNLPPATLSLLEATRTGNTGQVAAHVYWKSELNIQDAEGNTALHMACRYGFYSIASLLINGGSSHSIQNSDGYTPLAVAIENKQSDATSLLLEADADLEVVNKRKETLVHIAARVGDNTALKLLITKHVDVNEIDADGWTAFDTAILRKDVEAQHILKAAKAVQGGKAKLESSLYDAITAGDLERVEVLIRHGVNLASEDDVVGTPLYCAIGEKQKKIAILLRLAGAVLDSDRAVDRAIALDDIQQLEIIFALSDGINAKNRDGYAPLHRAVAFSSPWRNS